MGLTITGVTDPPGFELSGEIDVSNAGALGQNPSVARVFKGLGPAEYGIEIPPTGGLEG